MKKIRKIIKKLFGLYTETEMRYIQAFARNEKGVAEYYQKVVNEMARTGTLPPNCDLKLPKKSMIILVMGEDDNVKGEVIAKDGRWLRLPMDREKVIIRYI